MSWRIPSTKRSRDSDLDSLCDARNASFVDSEEVVVPRDQDTAVVGQGNCMLVTTLGAAVQWHTPLVCVDRVSDSANTYKDELETGVFGGNFELATDLDGGSAERCDGWTGSLGAVGVE